MTGTNAADFYVSPQGSDANPGTLATPFATLQRAQQAVRPLAGKAAVRIFLRGGEYYLPKPLIFEAADSGSATAPIIYQAYGKEIPVVSGGVKLSGLAWKPYKDGIFETQVPADLHTEEIFVNGRRQILARYPNFDAGTLIFNGFAPDAISKERAARWADPTGGYVHMMHASMWGGYTFRITGKTADGAVTMEGGWQNNRGGPPHEKYRMVENIFEELDAPGEWFLNDRTHTLYFYPPAGLDLAPATVEATRLRSLVEFRGGEAKPVRFIALQGLTFRHAARTVMETKEPLLRTDWAIYRGGAILFDGAEDCALDRVLIDQVGGTAVFVNDYNRRITIRGSHISEAGANGIAFIGDPKAARSPLSHYEQVQPLEKIDRTPGPQTNNYPADCLVEDTLIHLTGRVEKQTAGIEIDLAQDITVRHCSIYDVPRAGINIGDGCWGGHVIEYCDVFDTVLETGDHGSFNSWGRDRYWRPGIGEVDAVVKKAPDLPLLDVVKPITLRNNRWRCDHGWDIDLDDGSSNYIITNNLCLNRGIKNREGFARQVTNNVIANSSFFPHVWYAQANSVFSRNIIFAPYGPVGMKAPWDREMDHNFLHQPGAETGPATTLQSLSGRDEHSLAGDADFVAPERGDYRVKPGSPALVLGFKNFPMDQFGVTSPALKAVARTPVLPGNRKTASRPAGRDGKIATWQGARVRNILDEGEMSAYGLPGIVGVLVVSVPPGSPLAQAGVRNNDVILRYAQTPITALPDLLRIAPKTNATAALTIFRTQHEVPLNVKF
jgi:hypothetical protein